MTNRDLPQSARAVVIGGGIVGLSVLYHLTRMTRLRPYLDHGILELDNNTAARAMRSVAIGRKNYLFVGSQTGGRAAAIAYILIETANLNGIDPLAWLADTLARSPSACGHSITIQPHVHPRNTFDIPDRKLDEVGGSCSTGIECAKVQLSTTARKGATQ